MYRPAWRITQIGVTSTGSQRPARMKTELGAGICSFKSTTVSETPKHRKAPGNCAAGMHIPLLPLIRLATALYALEQGSHPETVLMIGFHHPFRGIRDFTNVSPC